MLALAKGQTVSINTRFGPILGTLVYPSKSTKPRGIHSCWYVFIEFGNVKETIPVYVSSEDVVKEVA